MLSLQVREEFYTAIDRCIAEQLVSKKQAIGCCLIFQKELNNIIWKTANEDENVVDLDTVPQNFCLRKEGKAREVLALKLIVDKIMDSAETSTITFHDDGSRKQGKIQPNVENSSTSPFVIANHRFLE